VKDVLIKDVRYVSDLVTLYLDDVLGHLGVFLAEIDARRAEAYSMRRFTTERLCLIGSQKRRLAQRVIGSILIQGGT